MAVAMCLMLPLVVFAQTYTGSTGLVVGTRAQHATSGFTVGAGDLYVAGKLMCSDGINQELVLIDPATASQTAYMNFAFEPNALMVAGGTTSYTLTNGDFTDIITPRNLVIISSATTAPTATFSGSVLITGTDAKGRAATETITISTNTTLYGTGNKAWSSVTSLALVITSTGNVSTAAFKLQVGSGNKIGMPADIQAAGDIYKVIEAGALTTTAVISAVYDTITFVNATDGSKDYHVFYKFKKR